MAKIKTRGIFIKRIITKTTVDEKTGKETKTSSREWLTCRVNAAVPYSHRMLQ